MNMNVVVKLEKDSSPEKVSHLIGFVKEGLQNSTPSVHTVSHMTEEACHCSPAASLLLGSSWVL